jgi:hypothetical protein
MWGTIPTPLLSRSEKSKVIGLPEIHSCQCKNIYVEYKSTVKFFFSFRSYAYGYEPTAAGIRNLVENRPQTQVHTVRLLLFASKNTIDDDEKLTGYIQQI